MLCVYDIYISYLYLYIYNIYSWEYKASIEAKKWLIILIILINHIGIMFISNEDAEYLYYIKESYILIEAL